MRKAELKAENKFVSDTYKCKILIGHQCLIVQEIGLPTPTRGSYVKQKYILFVKCKDSSINAGKFIDKVRFQLADAKAGEYEDVLVNGKGAFETRY